MGPWLGLGRWLGLGTWLGLGLRLRMAVLGRLLEPVLGVRLGSLVVWTLFIWPVAGLLLLSGLQLRLVRQSAAVQTGFIPEFVLRPRPVGKLEPAELGQ